jgi:hypothetical protein
MEELEKQIAYYTQLYGGNLPDDIRKNLENKYGSIANVRLYSQEETLQKLIAENVYELLGKKYKP